MTYWRLINRFSAIVGALFLLVLVVSQTHALSTLPQSEDVVDANLLSAIEKAVDDYLGRSSQGQLTISNLMSQDEWTIGTIALPAPVGEDSGPVGFLFIAQLTKQGLVVSIEGTEPFQLFVEQVPDALISAEAKRYLDINQAAPDGDGSAKLSLPFAVRGTWRLNGGPHPDSSGGSVWNALDFGQGDGRVLAARDGIVSRPCANLVQIVHGDGWKTGYYHLNSIAVNHGQTVTRGQFLGNSSTAVGCGGSASGVHVHFTLWSNNQPSAMHGKDIGGWTAQQGSQAYQGSLSKNGITANQWGSVWNDGTIGSSCPVGQMQGVYYPTRPPSGNPAFWRCESRPFYDWSTGGPGNGVPNDNFSVRWSGQYDFNGRTYRFATRTDDGVRLWLDDQLLIDQWRDMGPTAYRAYRPVSGRHTPMLEYYENGGGAVAQLHWSYDIGQSKPAYATSQQGSSYSPVYGNDSNLSTRWSSAVSSGTQWWWIDLGYNYNFDRIRVKWEAAYAAQYVVAWSTDGRNYTGYRYAISSACDCEHNIGLRNARYVALIMETRAPGLGNFSFWETQVYTVNNNLLGLPLEEPVEPLASAMAVTEVEGSLSQLDAVEFSSVEIEPLGDLLQIQGPQSPGLELDPDVE